MKTVLLSHPSEIFGPVRKSHCGLFGTSYVRDCFPKLWSKAVAQLAVATSSASVERGNSSGPWKEGALSISD